MIRKYCKKTNHRTSDCFHKKNRIKDKKNSLLHKTPQFDKSTELTKSGSNPVHNSNVGLKPLSGGNSLSQKSKSGNLDVNPKFEKSNSCSDSKSELNEEDKTLEKGI